MEGLKGKNILLVGATGGIGSKTAKLLSGSGANLFLTGRNDEKLRDVASQCSIPEERIFVLDTSNPEAVENLKARYFEQMPSIDILVNAAGVGIIKTMDTLDEADFMRSIQFNLFAPFLLVKAFLPAMKTLKKGLIINIPGVLGKVPMAGAAAYSASKHAVIGLTKSAAVEYGRKKIRVNAVCPAVINTEMFVRAVQADPKIGPAITQAHPVGRIGEADEVAAAVVWLSSDAASFVTVPVSALGNVALPVASSTRSETCRSGCLVVLSRPKPTAAKAKGSSQTAEYSCRRFAEQARQQQAA